MLVPDVNVLLNVQLAAQKHHTRANEWLREAGVGSEAVGLATVVLSAFVRIFTNTDVAGTLVSTRDAFSFCDYVLNLPATVTLREGPAHWDIFQSLVLESGVRGPDISDAYLAAFAIENNATFVTFDRGFHRFPGLKLQVLE